MVQASDLYMAICLGFHISLGTDVEAWGTPDALGQRWEVERVWILVVLELLLKPGMVTNTFLVLKKDTNQCIFVF